MREFVESPFFQAVKTLPVRIVDILLYMTLLEQKIRLGDLQEAPFKVLKRRGLLNSY